MRRWLERNHQTASELLVGFYRRATGRPSLTWAESVDEALCFGWIDGIRKPLDADAYTIRFTPRRARSVWSAVNIRWFGQLDVMGRVEDGGRAAFARRQESRSRIYAYEQAEQSLPEDLERRFQSDRRAWAFFQKQAPWYRRTASYWVLSAKREDTRQRRLKTLIEDSANGRRLGRLTRP